MRVCVFAVFSVIATSSAFGQAANINGNLSFNPTTSGVVGTTATDNALPGVVGEFMSVALAKSSSVSLTTGSAVNVMSLTLTAGDWNVWGEAVTNPAPGTTQSFVIAGFNSNSATLPPASSPNGASTDAFNIPAGNGAGLVPPMARISVASNTTIYLVASSNFSGGTNGAYGFMAARRIR